MNQNKLNSNLSFQQCKFLNKDNNLVQLKNVNFEVFECKVKPRFKLNENKDVDWKTFAKIWNFNYQFFSFFLKSF